MSQPIVSVVLHYENHDDLEKTLNSVKTILDQTNKAFEILLLSKTDDPKINKGIDEQNKSNIPFRILKVDDKSLGKSVNTAFRSAEGEFILYMDNRGLELFLKQAAIDLFLLVAFKNKKIGMVYADYEIVSGNTLKEIHLLKHHIGRVRDNQDYGKVFFFSKKALKEINFADENLKYNTLYDLRLKISIKYDLVHIANRYAGSLYQVVSEGKSHNVFDYLLASKESQLEAEQVLSNHLKALGAYLKPGSHYGSKPVKEKNTELKASVIIPVNNRPEFIGAAIESVQAQTVKEVEAIIVVNGGPDDPTCHEVRRYMPSGDKFNPDKPGVQLLIYDINNLGLCLNMGAKAARGEYYVQLDSDDRLKPDAVQKILDVYDSDDRIGMVIGSYEVWKLDEDGTYSRMNELPVVTHGEWTEENGRNNLLRINGAGAPRSLPIALIKKIGFSVNEEPFARNYGEDYNMVLEVSERHRIGRVWDPIYEVVRHAGGTDRAIDQHTIDRNDEAKDYMRAEAIKRRIKLNKS